MSVRVLSWVLEHSPVDHRGDLLVLLVLGDHAHDDGTAAYPSVDTIARKARLTRRGTQLALRRLEQAGAIAPMGKGPKGTINYQIILSEGANSLRGEVASRGEVSDTGGRTESYGGANPPSPEPSLEPSVKPSSPPNPPEGGRERDTPKYDVKDLEAWCATATPEFHSGIAASFAAVVQRHHRRTELTPDVLRSILTFTFPEGPDAYPKDIARFESGPGGWRRRNEREIRNTVRDALDPKAAAA